jgi:hypothetical protein
VNELGSLYVGQVPRPVKNHENAYRVLCSFPSLSRLPTAAPHPAAAVSPLRSPPSSRKEKPPPGAHRSPTTADPKVRTPEPRLPAQAPTECDGSASAAAPAPFAYLPLSRSRTPKFPIPSLNYFNITVACYACLDRITCCSGQRQRQRQRRIRCFFLGFKFVRFGMLLLIGAISPYLVVLRQKFSHCGVVGRNLASCVCSDWACGRNQVHRCPRDKRR